MTKGKPGYYNGKHYITYIEEVENLKRNGNLEEAERLLLELVKATEEENKKEKMGVAPWYYEQLAIIYRKQKYYDKEIAILEQCAKQAPPNFVDSETAKHWGDWTIKRIEKAKLLAQK